jgi:F420-non-reducing hydrogenase iron-sulfur subunit
MQPVSDSQNAAVSMTDAVLTVFVCANCARPGRPPAAGVRQPPAIPTFGWPCKAREVLVPCSGRLQPEHILKAFDYGSDAVAVIACDEANCHYLEGSRRILRRIEFVRGLLDDMGLSGRRLILAHLPGSAREDMLKTAEQRDLGLGTRDQGWKKDSVDNKGKPLAAPVAAVTKNVPLTAPSAAVTAAEYTRRIRAVRDEIVAQLQQLPPSGLKTADSGAGALAATYEEEVDASDDDNEE